MDFERGVLKFRIAPNQFFETPFLHEKDLDESKGGTKGFDVEAANQKIMELERMEEEERDKKKDGSNDKKDEDGDTKMT